jgi:anti-anti-sigma factor
VPREFEIAIERRGDTAIARVSGEFDLAQVERFTDAVRGLPDEFARVVLDLGQLTFLDSSGLREIVQLNGYAQRNGFELAVVPPHGSARQTLQVTGVEQWLHLIDSTGDEIGS